MARSRYKIYNEDYFYFITSSINCGLPIFSIPQVAKFILNALTFLREERDTQLMAYCIMEDHIHAIVQSEGLATKLGSFKSFTARKIIDLLKQHENKRILRQLKFMKKAHKRDCQYQFWQQGFHPIQIIGDDMMLQKMEYIHNNPVKRGWVDKPEHWRYSSARNYVNGKGVIAIDKFAI